MREIVVFVVSACLSSWSQSGQRHDVVSLDPDLARLMDLLDQLDGERTDMLAIKTDRNTSLLVGGGAGQFVIVYSGNDGSSWSRSSDKEPGQTIALVVGGQQGEFPSEIVCSQAEAQSTLKHWAFTGEIDPSTWVRDA